MIWITGGGTGGHLFPALNIAAELKRRHPALHLHYIGAARGLEAVRLPLTDFEYTLLPIAGDLRRGWVERAEFYLRLSASLMRCERLYRSTRPKLAIGTGGYASFPAARVALWHRVKLFWQEQNALAGQVTRRLGPRCERVFAGYRELAESLPSSRVTFTGNPVRADITQGDRRRGRAAGGFQAEDRVLLVLGGSGGAASINRAVARHWRVFSEQGRLRLWWQTGAREYEQWRRQITPELFAGTMTAFIDHVPDALAAADFVVARAGAMTTAEICAVGKPAILVPFPFAAADHQTQNAQALASAGAALMVKDQDLETGKLAEAVLSLAADPTLQAKLAVSARRLGRPDAVKTIADELEKYL
jgi:UDP-N-acetylglucosamine--N-acetylmuramyl-(pentapeptide) pyrophosphoryl-undecaprenol N-acetylglucosamine transferase